MANPVTTLQAAQHLRLGTLDEAETTELEMMITSATELAEAYCNRPFRASTMTHTFDKFPYSAAEPLICYSDAQSLTSLTYIDSAYASQEVTYVRTTNRAGYTRVYPSYGHEWPTDSCELPESITLVVASGDEANVPSAIKSAILLLVGDLYENRENSTVQAGLSASVKMNLSAERLMSPYKVRLA